MEVRIKDNNGYVDADWTIEDGIMVVSPKVEKFEPKDGDILFIKSSYDNIIIYKESGNDIRRYVNFSNNRNLYTDDLIVCDKDDVKEIRPATEEEKKLLFDKLKEEGYEWDAEKKELVKLKWKPVLGKLYYRPQFYQGYFEICKDVWNDSTSDEIFYNKCWCFKTKEECQEFCNRLNDAINSVKL